jgi:hypothetical protein
MAEVGIGVCVFVAVDLRQTMALYACMHACMPSIPQSHQSIYRPSEASLSLNLELLTSRRSTSRRATSARRYWYSSLTSEKIRRRRRPRGIMRWGVGVQTRAFGGQDGAGQPRGV